MQIRIAPSLGDLEHHPNAIWGTELYKPEFDGSLNAPCVFFGVYGFRDFFALWNHRGKKYILWAGSDIRHFVNGYWLDDEGGIRLEPWEIARWINLYCESFVENELEKRALEEVGIESKVVPSFLGRVEDFPMSFKPETKPRLYTSVSGNDFTLYGWHKIDYYASNNPDMEFHLYGNTKPFVSGCKNVFVHGRVPKEQMNAEIKSMTGAIRLTEFDGFSEIIAKSLLMGQWPVSLIEYPYTLFPHDIRLLKGEICSVPNLSGRNYYLSIINKYPWNLK